MLQTQDWTNYLRPVFFTRPLLVVTHKVRNLLAEHEWIENQQELFGKVNTMYDFKVNQPDKVRNQYKQYKEKMEKLEKQVNVRAMSLLDKCEEKVSAAIESYASVL